MQNYATSIMILKEAQRPTIISPLYIPSFSSHFDTFKDCSLEVLTHSDRAAVCSFIEPGLYNMLAPTIYIYNTLGQCVTDISMVLPLGKCSLS